MLIGVRWAAGMSHVDTDLECVGIRPGLVPPPPLDVHEPGRPDDLAIGRPVVANGKAVPSSCVGEGLGHVVRRFGLAVGNPGEAEGRAVACGRSCERRGVGHRERDQAHMRAREGQRFHILSLAEEGTARCR